MVVVVGIVVIIINTLYLIQEDDPMIKSFGLKVRTMKILLYFSCHYTLHGWVGIDDTTEKVCRMGCHLILLERNYHNLSSKRRGWVGTMIPMAKWAC